LDVRGYATNYPILGEIYTAIPKTVTLSAAPTTTDFKRIDVIAADTTGDIIIILGTEGLIGIEPSVDPNLYFKIRPLLLTTNATTPVDPVTGTGTLSSFVLFKEFGTVAGGESDVTGSDASIAISTVTPITGAKSIEAITASNLDYAQFLLGTTQTTTGKTHFNFNLKLKASVQTTRYWFFRVYNGTSLIGSFLFKHGQYGFNANDLGVQSISIPLTSTPFLNINYTKIRLFFYHSSGTIAGYFIDDVEFLNALPTIVYDNYTIGSSGNEKVTLYKNGVLSTETDLKTILNPVSLSPITTANKLVTESELTTKEDIANKQNNLTPDGTGIKYPTVDAVNAGLDLKLDASAYNQHFKGVYLTLAALNAAHPTASAGDYAQVNETGAADVLNYNWDAEENLWIPNAVGGSGATNTDELPEGTSNLYHTGARVLATVLTGISFVTGTVVVSTDTVLQAFGKLQKQITDLISTVNGKQATLVSGTNIKTINSESLLGAGNVVITGGASDPNSATITITTLSTPVNSAFTTAAGTLAIGTYYYRVTATNAYGQTLPSTETSLTLDAVGGVNVNWQAVTGATGYKVYGRTTGAELLIATVGAVLTYLDSGSITPAGAMPTANTTFAPLTSATITDGGYSQEGKVNRIMNGVNVINFTVNGVTASFVKGGTGAITFVQGAGRTLTALNGVIFNGAVGSTASIASFGTVDYLYINNLT
ncbi:MAG: hypothetical protein WAW57_15400, partial [Lutibacter sp.]